MQDWGPGVLLLETGVCLVDTNDDLLDILYEQVSVSWPWMHRFRAEHFAMSMFEIWYCMAHGSHTTPWPFVHSYTPMPT